MKRFPRRPPRLSRVIPSDPIYFVSFCTRDRRPLLQDSVVHAAWRQAAEKISGAGNAVGRYVIMPDYVHVFLRIGREGRLGLAVKCLKETLLKKCSHLPRDLWQAGFFDHVLRSGEGYSEKWLYVRDNPVRAGLVERAEDWPYQGECERLDL